MEKYELLVVTFLVNDLSPQVSFGIMGERQSIIREYIEKQQESELWRQDHFNHLISGFTEKLNEAHDLLSNQESHNHSGLPSNYLRKPDSTKQRYSLGAKVKKVMPP